MIDYFFVGDFLLLKCYKDEYGLLDDVVLVFMIGDSGDYVVFEGIVILLVGIENYLYMVIFMLDDGMFELLKVGSCL